MADNESLLRRIHAHEANKISVGSVGVAKYDQQTQQWTFQRDLAPSERQTQDVFKTLKVLNNQQLGGRKCHDSDLGSKASKNLKIDKQNYETAPAQYIIQGLAREKVNIESRLDGTKFAQGSAVWLAVNESYSGNATVPITATVTGPGHDQLVIACVGREHVDYTNDNGLKVSARIPSLTSDIKTSVPMTRGIMQLVFSGFQKNNATDTFLAVRQAMQTSIFEPLLTRDFRWTKGSESALDSNLLLVIHRSCTGGADHADAAFNPHDRRQLAIVDVEGNWSTWRIQGQRTRKARELYQAEYVTSGKIFSWAAKQRPLGVGLYFDGWHKILWLSSDQVETDRILVCNRQNAKLFDVAGDVVSWIDVRLDTSKTDAYILGVEPGPNLSSCVILTTTDILLFDFSRPDWKDPIRSKGPQLTCAIIHNRSGFDLRMKTLTMVDSLLISIYQPGDRAITLYRLVLDGLDDIEHVALSICSRFEFPEELLEVSLSSFSFLAIVTEPRIDNVILLIVQDKELLLHVSLLETTGKVIRNQMIRLPPARGLQLKTSQYVEDNATATSDVDDFVVNDMVEQHCGTGVVAMISNSQSGSDQVIEHVKSTEMTHGLGEIVDNSSNQTQRQHISAALPHLEAMSVNMDGTRESNVLLDKIDLPLRIDDIEIDSRTLERALHVIKSSDEQISISNLAHMPFTSLLEVYESLFDKYVTTLGMSVSDFSRVRRERQAREVALQLYLSGQIVTIKPNVSEENAADSASQYMSDMGIFSDPVQPRHMHYQVEQTISASQPVKQSESADPAVIPSPIPDILARLSAYTKIGKFPMQESITDKSTSKNLTSILSHLPVSPEADPASYDYKESELNAAILIGESVETDQQKRTRSRESRKSTKPKEGLEKYTLPILPKRQEAPGSPKRRRASSGTGGLPPLSSQPRVRFDMDDIASEGIIFPDSSQTLAEDSHKVNSTQPERGAYGSRSTNPRQKHKKKQKRMAGF